ncbi:enoyl-CoA hydratase/isomerase family protein [Zhengella sp. ZM62]|uniref:enoyl-CoA hydratase/isomerase family protein n=1 Tax=Zhengella sedimenti TaxID=3390035 RepID=UPI003976B84B
MDFGGGGEIRFEQIGRAGVITMTRPKALNALTHSMVKAMGRAMDAWEGDDGIALVVMRGEGRAFCAGGDIMDIYRAGREGRVLTAFFHDEYRLNARIHRFPKPWVSLIDGIVMGGGCGVSMNGAVRVFGDKGVIAMPEVGIGFFPDVGGSHFLPRLRGRSGYWMGLTGERVKQGDALAIGAATHAVASADLEALLDALCETGDAAASLMRYSVRPEPETGAQTFAAIDRLFAGSSLEAVLSALEKAAGEGEEFAAKTLGTMAGRSPTSLHVAFRQLASGADLSMDDCMRMEFRIVNRMLTGHDFYEGIRAVLVDRDNTPAWKPATVEAVDPADIDAYFAPLPGGELPLP